MSLSQSLEQRLRPRIAKLQPNVCLQLISKQIRPWYSRARQLGQTTFQSLTRPNAARTQRQIAILEKKFSDAERSSPAAYTNAAGWPIRHTGRNPFDRKKRLPLARSWWQTGLASAAVSLYGLYKYGWPVLAGLTGLGIASYVYMTRFEPTHPTLEHVTLQLPDLPPELDGLRIGQITDPHIGMPHSTDNLRWAVAQMHREQPDLLLLTGDLAGRREGITELAALLTPLHAALGVYAVPGNHDYWEGLADVQSALALAGIPLLINENRGLTYNGCDFWIVGVDEIWDGRPDFRSALAGVPAQAFTILLAHSPDLADNAIKYNFALQVSGHTHGGHLRLPGLGPITSPRYGRRYVMGLYRIGTMDLYVSRGLGGVPLRLFCRPETTIFTLRRTRAIRA